MRIAFLGTGIMGAPMARRLAEAGNDVTVWNRSRDKAEPLGEHGATVAGSPQEAVTGADVLVTMLADGSAVEAVIEQAVPGIEEGATWWQASTVGIDALERLGQRAERLGLAFVDAPVLGTKGPAEEGKLTVLAAGAEDALDRCAPLFDAVGGRTLRLGAVGAATRAKLVLNHWVLAVTEGIAETIALAEALGVDPGVFLQAIEGGTLDIGYAHIKGPGMIRGELPVAFPLKLALKDAELVLAAARKDGVDLGLAPVIRDRLARAADAGHGDDDMGMVIAATRPAR
jgi:3-hydroxyisobutyrate dehydrogenase